MESLLITIEELDPDIIVLTEHNLKNYEIERLNVEHFKINTYFCRDNIRKGGVVILSRSFLKFKKITIPNINNILEDKQFEFCAGNFSLGSYSFILVGIYRSPSSNTKRVFRQA